MCAGKPCKFTVVTANAGAGTLCAQVEGPSKVALVCSEVPDGYEFSYTPMAPGKYMIMIKYSNITIAGAPFKSVITGQSPPLYRLHCTAGWQQWICRAVVGGPAGPAAMA